MSDEEVAKARFSNLSLPLPCSVSRRAPARRPDARVKFIRVAELSHTSLKTSQQVNLSTPTIAAGKE